MGVVSLSFLSSSLKKSKSTHGICPGFLVQLLVLFLLAPPTLYNTELLLFRLVWLSCSGLGEGVVIPVLLFADVPAMQVSL